jgi:putative Mg2+ transporter-C (MgtC) family protein
MVQQLFYPLDVNGVILTLCCAGLVGLERQLRGRPAGMRTSMLICLGAHTFAALGASIQGPNVDPTRVLGQIITGIGFLGAGVILARGGLVFGVTSASAIWMLAAIGSTIGLGYHSAGASLTFVTLLVLVVLDLFEANLEQLRQGVHAPQKQDAAYRKGEGAKE